MNLTTPSMNARQSDPATSHEAASMAVQFSRAQRDRILAILRKHGKLGAEEITKLTEGAEALHGMQAYQVRKRLTELEREKLAAPTDETRRTDTGRSERLWIAL